MKAELVNVKPTTTQRTVNIPTVEKDLKKIIKRAVKNLKKDVRANKPTSLLQEKSDFIKKLLVDREFIMGYVNCIVLVIRCPSLKALHDLYDDVTTKRLQESFAETYFTEEWKASHGIDTIDVEITICHLEYVQCERELQSQVSVTARKPHRITT